MDWEREYRARCMSAEGALGQIRDGDRVVTSFGCGEPRGVERALQTLYKQFHNVEIINMLMLGDTPWVFDEKYGDEKKDKPTGGTTEEEKKPTTGDSTNGGENAGGENTGGSENTGGTGSENGDNVNF